MNIQKLEELMQNNDIKMNLFICFLCISLIQIFDTKIILSIGLFICIVLNYSKNKK